VELLAVLFMIAAGAGLALVVVAALAIARREAEDGAAAARSSPPDLERLATSILCQLLLLGGVRRDEALREIRRRSGLMAPVTDGVDVASWGERFARLTAPQQRTWLLDIAVQCVAARSTPVPLRQYSALLDLSFSLGFQTDALAKLRDKYGFEYVDPAKAGRPREADRSGGATTFFARDPRPREELLRVLEIDGAASRQAVITAYRRLAAQHHPDRVYDAPPDVQAAAAARFIEITRAYEALLAFYRE
jgi:DnaJ-domain-containing protein 1